MNEEKSFIFFHWQMFGHGSDSKGRGCFHRCASKCAERERFKHTQRLALGSVVWNKWGDVTT